MAPPTTVAAVGGFRREEDEFDERATNVEGKLAGKLRRLVWQGDGWCASDERQTLQWSGRFGGFLWRRNGDPRFCTADIVYLYRFHARWYCW